MHSYYFAGTASFHSFRNPTAQCQVLVPSSLSPFALLKTLRSPPEQAELPWAVSLLSASGWCLIPTSSPFWTPLPPLCLRLALAFCSRTWFLVVGPQGLPPPASLGAPCPFCSAACPGSFWSLLLFRDLIPMLSMGNVSSWCFSSSQIPIEVHSIHLSMSRIKNPLKRCLYLLFLIPLTCWVSSPFIRLLLHHQVFFI